MRTRVTPELEVTALIAGQVRSRRGELCWSAERLAEEMVKAGFDWTRGLVSKLETGRRETVTVGELLSLAAVLEVGLDALLPGLLHKCETCHGNPPVGFACRTCGAEGETP